MIQGKQMESLENVISPQTACAGLCRVARPPAWLMEASHPLAASTRPARGLSGPILHG